MYEMNWLQSDPPHRTIRLDEISALSGNSFIVDLPTRLDVVASEVLIPLLVVRRDSSRLIVLNNGAVDIDRSDGRPVFQRSSWWQDIESHQIYICDPGTVGPEAITLNWMQSAPPLWLLHQISKIIRAISQVLDVKSGTDRTYFGSSAGGFSALSSLVYDPKANAIVNNAQFDWTRWYAKQVRQVLGRNFVGLTAADVRSKWPHRANALHSLARRDAPQTVDYWVNLASDYDRTVQLPLWNDMLEKHPQIAANFTLHCYYDEEKGHNPLSRGQSLDLLNNRYLQT